MFRNAHPDMLFTYTITDIPLMNLVSWLEEEGIHVTHSDVIDNEKELLQQLISESIKEFPVSPYTHIEKLEFTIKEMASILHLKYEKEN